VKVSVSDQSSRPVGADLLAVDLGANYFALFDLPVDYLLDHQQLKQSHLRLQRAVHPDRFANQPDSSQLQAVRCAALVNEAFDTLSCPLKRAFYLLELAGHPVDKEQTITDVAFFEEQMSLREQLEAGRSRADAETLALVQQHAQGLMTRLTSAFVEGWRRGGDAGYAAASDSARKMHFVQRLLEEAQQPPATGSIT